MIPYGLTLEKPCPWFSIIHCRENALSLEKPVANRPFRAMLSSCLGWFYFAYTDQATRLN